MTGASLRMIKNNLEHIRTQKSMSKTQFVFYLGIVSEMQYTRYEKSTQQPTLVTALKIAKKLNKTVDEIWSIDENDE